MELKFSHTENGFYLTNICWSGLERARLSVNVSSIFWLLNTRWQCKQSEFEVAKSLKMNVWWKMVQVFDYYIREELVARIFLAYNFNEHFELNSSI